MIDDKKNIPKSDQNDYSPYEKRLIFIADENIRRAAQKWTDEDKKLKGEYCRAKREYIDAIKDLNTERASHGKALQKYDEALKQKRDSSTYPHLSHKGYWTFIIVLALSEFFRYRQQRYYAGGLDCKEYN
jgi:lipoate-protein ligase A